MVARGDVEWMPERNRNFPGEDTDQLKEISTCPETMMAVQFCLCPGPLELVT